MNINLKLNSQEKDMFEKQYIIEESNKEKEFYLHTCKEFPNWECGKQIKDKRKYLTDLN